MLSSPSLHCFCRIQTRSPLKAGTVSVVPSCSIPDAIWLLMWLLATGLCKDIAQLVYVQFKQIHRHFLLPPLHSLASFPHNLNILCVSQWFLWEKETGRSELKGRMRMCYVSHLLPLPWLLHILWQPSVFPLLFIGPLLLFIYLFCFQESSYEWNHGICLFQSNLLHLA